ncbi:hypothetical protein SKAU_G00304530 [Synaphobranchus kaupii]|uniref:Uncharacterized protein n=1 Tax=Synaphobranchus kaupii TaxID=118154 RepID=A0A9Q1EWD0_SYNKA|nr:hypothetical protein SKAU_G00304530 [Synaphobranchus kaupii]
MDESERFLPAYCKRRLSYVLQGGGGRKRQPREVGGKEVWLRPPASHQSQQLLRSQHINVARSNSKTIRRHLQPPRPHTPSAPAFPSLLPISLYFSPVNRDVTRVARKRQTLQLYVFILKFISGEELSHSTEACSSAAKHPCELKAAFRAEGGNITPARVRGNGSKTAAGPLYQAPPVLCRDGALVPARIRPHTPTPQPAGAQNRGRAVRTAQEGGGGVSRRDVTMA